MRKAVHGHLDRLLAAPVHHFAREITASDDARISNLGIRSSQAERIDKLERERQRVGVTTWHEETGNQSRLKKEKTLKL